MQAHTQQEFEASLKQGVSTADRLEGGGWLPVTCEPIHSRPDSDLYFFVNSMPNKNSHGNSGKGHNFEVEPWSRHAIQFEGNTVPSLATVCIDGPSKHQAYLVVASAHRIGNGGVPARSRDLYTRVRSLGYVGAFLREYSSVVTLLQRNDDSDLLRVVAAPSQQESGSGASKGTFVPAVHVGSLDTSRVPLNTSQRDAVMKLNGGLDIIVGPPGNVKLCTWSAHPRSKVCVTGGMLFYTALLEKILRLPATASVVPESVRFDALWLFWFWTHVWRDV